MHVFRPGQRGTIDKFAHAQVILQLGLCQEAVQLCSGTFLLALEERTQSDGVCGKHPLFLGAEHHTVGGVEARQLVVIADPFSEVREEAFEHFGHPVETGTHVEREALVTPYPGAAARFGVLLHDRHLEAFAGQRSCCGQAGETGTDDKGVGHQAVTFLSVSISIRR